MLQVFIFEKKIDFLKYVDDNSMPPTRNVKRRISFSSFNELTYPTDLLFLQQNEVELKDRWWEAFGFPSFTGNFYDTAIPEQIFVNKVGNYSKNLYSLSFSPTK